ncbi:MAG: hypothetical protein WA919_22650 [Coleofasciculaceae cyanobacterium]
MGRIKEQNVPLGETRSSLDYPLQTTALFHVQAWVGKWLERLKTFFAEELS